MMLEPPPVKLSSLVTGSFGLHVTSAEHSASADMVGGPSGLVLLPDPAGQAPRCRLPEHVGLRGKDPFLCPLVAQRRALSQSPAPLRSRRIATPDPAGPAEDLGDLGLRNGSRSLGTIGGPQTGARSGFGPMAARRCLRIRPSRSRRTTAKHMALGRLRIQAMGDF